MPSELPPDLREAVNRMHGQPLHLIDPDTNVDYVLVPASMYRPAVTPAFGDDDLSETYPAQEAAALAAGWGEPEMADYDDYDAKRKSLG